MIHSKFSSGINIDFKISKSEVFSTFTEAYWILKMSLKFFFVCCFLLKSSERKIRNGTSGIFSSEIWHYNFEKSRAVRCKPCAAVLNWSRFIIEIDYMTIFFFNKTKVDVGKAELLFSTLLNNGKFTYLQTNKKF